MIEIIYTDSVTGSETRVVTKGYEVDDFVHDSDLQRAPYIRVILEADGSGRLEHDLRGLPPGTYKIALNLPK